MCSGCDEVFDVQEEVDSAVKELLALKAEYKKVSGVEYKAAPGGEKKTPGK